RDHVLLDDLAQGGVVDADMELLLLRPCPRDDGREERRSGCDLDRCPSIDRHDLAPLLLLQSLTRYIAAARRRPTRRSRMSTPTTARMMITVDMAGTERTKSLSGCAAAPGAAGFTGGWPATSSPGSCRTRP